MPPKSKRNKQVFADFDEKYEREGRVREIEQSLDTRTRERLADG